MFFSVFAELMCFCLYFQAPLFLFSCLHHCPVIGSLPGCVHLFRIWLLIGLSIYNPTVSFSHCEVLSGVHIVKSKLWFVHALVSSSLSSIPWFLTLCLWSVSSLTTCYEIFKLLTKSAIPTVYKLACQLIALTICQSSECKLACLFMWYLFTTPNQKRLKQYGK